MNTWKGLAQCARLFIDDLEKTIGFMRSVRAASAHARRRTSRQWVNPLAMIEICGFALEGRGAGRRSAGCGSERCVPAYCD